MLGIYTLSIIIIISIVSVVVLKVWLKFLIKRIQIIFMHILKTKFLNI